MAVTFSPIFQWAFVFVRRKKKHIYDKGVATKRMVNNYTPTEFYRTVAFLKYLQFRIYKGCLPYN